MGLEKHGTQLLMKLSHFFQKTMCKRVELNTFSVYTTELHVALRVLKFWTNVV